MEDFDTPIDDDSGPETAAPLGRVARRRRKNLEALIRAGREVMGEKGIDAATMAEIAERADIGAGTVYTFFKSKDELAIAVLESLMTDLGNRIEQVTDTFEDPAQVYAFGVRTLIDTCIGDLRWRQLLNRSEVMAGAMFRQMGPFATRDLKNASHAGRFRIGDADLVWRMANHAIMGIALAITSGEMEESMVQECVIRILCMNGITLDEARDLAARPRPALPPG
jgi:AcrR family transcriptional regulator